LSEWLISERGVKPPDQWIENTVTGITSVILIPYEYANWALEYLGCAGTVDIKSEPTIRIMWQIHEACLQYQRDKGEVN
jgi:hypothetical protein